MRESLASPGVAETAEFVVIGADPEDGPEALRRSVGRYDPATGERGAGALSGAAIQLAIQLALEGEVDGIVTGPVSKSALAAAGYDVPGQTEFLRDRCGVPEVTMMMCAERTALGGPLRMALLTTHLPLREVAEAVTLELTVTRARIAAEALRRDWGFDPPRLAFAGLNPHASEGGRFGDEEARVLEPAARLLEQEGLASVVGIFPADTVFRLCLDGTVDAVVVPYHDVGLAVFKTVAGGRGVNITAGLPFPRTSPDHGTAMDIAGRGLARPDSMIEAIRQCARFCRIRGGAAA